IAAFPGSSKKEMLNLKKFCINKLKHTPKQVQIFTPTPSTVATMMYYTKKDTHKNPIYCAGTNKEKEMQKKILTGN
ncbi:MAG: DUF3362 domain-containing protein, partial [Thermodesulfobacteriota bacterium]